MRFIDRIVKPVRELAGTSRQVRASGNFALRATSPEANLDRDEISELVDSFNAMLAEIERRERELASYHQLLESRVLERTASLHTANRELQLAKEAAEAAAFAKSRFLAAASHDLRQPIQAIKLFKDALDMTGLNGEQKRISHFLSRAILNLGELLDALLDISKLDTGAVAPQPGVIGVHALFSDIDAEFSVLAAAKSLRFKFSFPPGATALFTDGALLQGLLRNLIGNAIKYTERGGVLVALRRRGDQALIQVWDTGIGIAPEHRAMIFDEYFQVGNPERDKAKGLGLGLAIARRLATLLNTEIVCHSRPGKGSVFEFRLPLAPNGRNRPTLPYPPAPTFLYCELHGSLPHLDGYRRPGRNRRQDAAPRLHPGRQIPQAAADHRRHPGGHGGQPCLCRRARRVDHDTSRAGNHALGARRVLHRHGAVDADSRQVDDEDDAKLARFGVFGTTLVAFFMAEMGDKTQVATVALAAQFQAIVSVVAGTTLGMMIANVPAVLLGDRIAQRMPVRLVHAVAAAIFAVLGIATLLGAGERFGI